MKVVGIIQARSSSTRLPQKVLLKLLGTPLLIRVIERVRKSKKIDSLVVATTHTRKDIPIVKLCIKHKVPFFRGSEKDVMDRYVQTGVKYPSDIVVRITADNPFVDPRLFDKLIRKHVRERNDYTFASGFPIGVSCEIFNFQSLKKVNKLTKKSSYHEHLGAYFLDHKAKFKVASIKAPRDLNFPEIRLTIDTPEDFETAKRLLKILPKNFGLKDIIKIWKSARSVFLNQKVVQRYPNMDIKKQFQGK